MSSVAELRKGLVKELPDHLKIANFTIESMEKTTSDGKPKYAIRYTATVEATEKLYRVTEVRGDTVFLKEKTQAGETGEVAGTASSILSTSNKWTHFVRLDDHEVRVRFGEPRSKVSKGKAIVAGSEEEAQFLADLQATDAQFQSSIDALDLDAMLAEFYDGKRKGNSFLHEVLAFNIDKRSNINAIVHAKFTWVKAEDRTKVRGTSRRAFTLRRKEDEPWRVTYMGPRDSGKIE